MIQRSNCYNVQQITRNKNPSKFPIPQIKKSAGALANQLIG